jgi:hypothetical protein
MILRPMRAGVMFDLCGDFIFAGSWAEPRCMNKRAGVLPKATLFTHANRLTHFFADQAYFRALFKIALPISLQYLISNSLNMVGVILIGQLGDTSVAAVGLASQIFFLFSLLLFGRERERRGTFHLEVEENETGGLMNWVVSCTLCGSSYVYESGQGLPDMCPICYEKGKKEVKKFLEKEQKRKEIVSIKYTRVRKPEDFENIGHCLP